MKLILSTIVLFYLVISCSNNNKDPRVIQLAYPETQIELNFRTAGSITPTIIDWDGEPGTYSIASSNQILQGNVFVLDTLSGQISWGTDFPVGTYYFTITAKSGKTTTAVEIMLTNTFKEGFFSGDFQAIIDPENPLSGIVAIDYGLRLNEDGSILMEKYSNPALLFSGNWSITEDGGLSVAFLTNLSGGKTTYMKGFLTFSEEENKLPLFNGKYGASLDENQEIENQTGIFIFLWG